MEKKVSYMRGEMKYSAGLLVARSKKEVEFMLVHLGGPLWGNRDDEPWSSPKGIIEHGCTTGFQLDLFCTGPKVQSRKCNVHSQIEPNGVLRRIL